jgi:hypothetical protein
VGGFKKIFESLGLNLLNNLSEKVEKKVDLKMKNNLLISANNLY